MAGESQKTPNTGQADPSVFTQEAIERANRAQRDYIDAQFDVLRQRLSGMDKATEVLNEAVTRTPTEIQREVSHLRELDEEKFQSIQTQFRERDIRSERESRDDKVAVDAAFAAQKESAAAENQANTKAIDKSEKTTIETINKNAELSKATTDGLGEKISAVERRMERFEATKQGAADNQDTRRLDSGLLLSVVIALVAIAALAVTVLTR